MEQDPMVLAAYVLSLPFVCRKNFCQRVSFIRSSPGGTREELASGLVSALSPHPHLLASKIKHNFLTTSLACLMIFEQEAAGPGFGNMLTRDFEVIFIFVNMVVEFIKY